MPVRFPRVFIAACVAVFSVTGLQAQDTLIPIGKVASKSTAQLNSDRSVIQLRSSRAGNRATNSAVSSKSSKVPQSLVNDPNQVKSAAIQKDVAAATPIPRVLQGAKDLNVHAPRLSKEVMQTPRVARTVAAWGDNTKTHAHRSGARPIPTTNSTNRVAGKGQNISRTAPAISTEIVAPEFINLNQTATMRINVRNTGTSEIQNVRLITTLPSHAKFQISNPQPEKVDGQTYQFLMSSIGANQVRQITVDLVPTEKRPLDIGTQVVVENRQRIEVSVRQPQLNVRINGPAQVSIGDVVEYTVIIENTGDGIAQSVKLEADLPEELKFSDQKGMEVAKNLAPGATRKVVVKSIAQKPGEVDLSFIANAVGIKSEKAGLLLKIVQPELKVSVAGPKMNFVNRDGIYTIRLDNNGEVEVSNVEVKLQIPAGMKVTTINRPAKTDDRDRTLAWTFDRIGTNGSEIIQLKATATKAGEQLCKVDVSSKQTRTKQFAMSTMVASRAEMSVNVRNQSGPVQVGEKAKFTIALENTGSSTADAVSVRVELPESVMPVKQDGITVDQFNRSFVFNRPALKAGEKHDFSFSVVGVVGGEFVVRGILESSGSGRQVIAEDSVYVYEVDEFRVSESLSPSMNR